MAGQTVFIGCGAGFAGDRTDAAGPVVETLAHRNGPRFLMFETLAERTLALAQLERRADPSRGYNPALERFVGPVLKRCLAEGIRIVGNFGAANPRAAAARIASLAREQGIKPPRIAVIEGDDLSGLLSPGELAARETGGKLLAGNQAIISANLYLGAHAIAEALDRGAEIVITGRVADSALALGPLIHMFKWKRDDWDRLAAGTLAGHLLECGAQITGGYFADPGVKDVPALADVGYPIAEIASDGSIVVTKASSTGGMVDRLTVIEQLLYEIHDPAAYLAPDVVLDLTDVEVEEAGQDRVRVTGARGRPAPADTQGHRLRRWRRARRGRDFLRWAECRWPRPSGRRSRCRPHAQTRPASGISNRCHRRRQRARQYRPQRRFAGRSIRHPPALRRARRHRGRCRNPAR